MLLVVIPVYVVMARHAACRSDNNMVKQLLIATRTPGHVQPVGRPCGTWMHYAMRDGCEGHGSTNGLP